MHWQPKRSVKHTAHRTRERLNSFSSLSLSNSTRILASSAMEPQSWMARGSHCGVLAPVLASASGEVGGHSWESLILLSSRYSAGGSKLRSTPSQTVSPLSASWELLWHLTRFFLADRPLECGMAEERWRGEVIFRYSSTSSWRNRNHK